MKKRFLLAESPSKQLVVAILAANVRYVKANSGMPTPEFYEEFLEPFFEYEFKKTQLEQLHSTQALVTRRQERELIESIAFWSKKCIEKLEGK